jgi:hypothetical protein
MSNRTKCNLLVSVMWGALKSNVSHLKVLERFGEVLVECDPFRGVVCNLRTATVLAVMVPSIEVGPGVKGLNTWGQDLGFRASQLATLNLNPQP